MTRPSVAEPAEHPRGDPRPPRAETEQPALLGPTSPGFLPPAPAGLPVIRVNNRQLDDLTDDAIAALLAANAPLVLARRGGLLARLHAVDDSVRPALAPLSLDALSDRLSRVAEWTVARKSRDGESHVEAAFPPMRVVRNVLASAARQFPRLDAVIEAPVFWRDGSLVATPGYHPAASVWCHLAPGLVIPPVPSVPEPHQILHARSLLLDELLGDFPFDDEAGRAHALAALLLPFVRPMIDGPTPLHLIDAPMQGTGKTLTAQVIGHPALGRPLDAMAEGRDDDEWRKRVTATLIQAPVYVLIDNLRRPLSSGALASVLTARSWKDRLLGVSEMADLPVGCGWLATGNNVTLSPEFVRRTVLIRLDARTDRPWLRSGFRHHDILAWAGRHRGELIHAALTLIRGWIAAGRPRGSQVLGMYESWAGTMGGVLGVAGVPGFLGNLDALGRSVEDAEGAWLAFLEAWRREIGGQPVGTDALFTLASRDGLLGEVLGAEGERSQRIRLGKALAARRDQTIGGYHLERTADDHKGRAVYRLRRLPRG